MSRVRPENAQQPAIVSHDRDTVQLGGLPPQEAEPSGHEQSDVSRW